jgi:hypothetical protein
MPSTFFPALSSHLWRALVLALACALLAAAANARGQRIALVIGNGNYQQPDLPKLANPTNDAEDIAKALRGFGFDVIERKNQTLEGMNQAIAEFGSKIGGSEAALFYYAGHGIQVKNQNYLIPVNARIESEASVPYQGVNLNQVLDEMDNGKSGANIVMLDACRNNPITGKFRSGQSRGLASPGSAPKGTVIVYATDPGNVASDGTGRNGLFTAGLLTAFKGKDLTLDGVLTTASAEVEKASGQAQTPLRQRPEDAAEELPFSGHRRARSRRNRKDLLDQHRAQQRCRGLRSLPAEIPERQLQGAGRKPAEKAQGRPAGTRCPFIHCATHRIRDGVIHGLRRALGDHAHLRGCWRGRQGSQGLHLQLLQRRQGRAADWAKRGTRDSGILDPGRCHQGGRSGRDQRQRPHLKPGLCGGPRPPKLAVLVPHARHLHADERQGNADRTPALRSHFLQELTRFPRRTDAVSDPRKFLGPAMPTATSVLEGFGGNKETNGHRNAAGVSCRSHLSTRCRPTALSSLRRSRHRRVR